MARLIDSRDVLDPDGMTRRSFTGRVIGHYKRTGANSWDPYKFVMEDGGTLEVLPGLKIQLEARGARFRMRKEGRVLRVEWVPEAGEVASRGGQRAQREAFLARYITTFDEPAGKGAGYLASKLIR